MDIGNYRYEAGVSGLDGGKRKPTPFARRGSIFPLIWTSAAMVRRSVPSSPNMTSPLSSSFRFRPWLDTGAPMSIRGWPVASSFTIPRTCRIFSSGADASAYLPKKMDAITPSRPTKRSILIFRTYRSSCSKRSNCVTVVRERGSGKRQELKTMKLLPIWRHVQ